MTARAKTPDMSAQNDAARRQADIAERMADLAEREYESGQALIDRYAPVYEKLMQSQIDSSALSDSIARDQWDQYQSVFKPLESEFVDAARSYDDPGKVEQRAAADGATVQRQFDAVRGQTQRTLAASGVSPSSGRTAQTMTDQDNALALAKAGALNKSRSNSEQTALALQSQAIGIGRGLPGTALSAGSTASGQTGAAAGIVGQRIGAAGQPASSAASLFGGASSAMGGAASQFGNIANQQYRVNQGRADQINSIVGIGAGLFMSDEKKKRDVKPVDDDEALEAMRQIPVSEWDYAPGQGDGGHHIGPMAQDVKAAAGDGVAPGGVAIDPISANGLTMAAVRALDRKVTALEGGGQGGRRKPGPADDQFESMEFLPL